jgi:hypothetical protein
MLGGEFCRWGAGFSVLAGGGCEAGFAEDLEAHVAAAFGPFVGEHGADEADDRGPVGEDPDDVGAAADFFVEPFLRVIRADLLSTLT